MLTREERNYLKKIDPLRKANVFPFDPIGKKLGDEIVLKIRNSFPNAVIKFMGSAALGISGQKDVDIYVLADANDFADYLPDMEKLFGEINKQGDYVKKRFVEWKFKQEGYDIEIYLTEPPNRQIKVFILRSDNKLLKEYEELKWRFNGRSYRDYQEAKYKFYNKMLNDNK